jgi:hypothetical protein
VAYVVRPNQLKIIKLEMELKVCKMKTELYEMILKLRAQKIKKTQVRKKRNGEKVIG